MKNFFRKLFGPIIWVNLLAMLVVAVGLVYGVKLWLDYYTRHGQTIEVPNVVGKTPLDALAVLQMCGLRTEIADSSYNSKLPAGIILLQRPRAGSQVKEGREIHLTINSRTAPTMVIPDIAGNSSVREAQVLLQELGFKIGNVEYVDGDAGWVYGIKCNGRDVFNGEQVPVGATIVLLVGGKMYADSLEEDFLPSLEEDTYDYE